MKKWTRIFSLVCSIIMIELLNPHALAQPDHDLPPMDGQQREKIESLRRAYYTKELNLSVSEAEKFWPIYNTFENSKRQLHKEMKNFLDQEIQFIQSANDLENFTKKLGLMRQKETEQLLEYLKQSTMAIGLEKTKSLIGIDERFRKEVGEKLKERRENNNGAQPRRKR
jgi:hypothetical protein